MLLHFLQKFFCNRVTRAITYNRICSAVWTHRGSLYIFYPFFYFRGRKNFQTVKATADRIVLQAFFVVHAMTMCQDNGISAFHLVFSSRIIGEVFASQK